MMMECVGCIKCESLLVVVLSGSVVLDDVYSFQD